MQAFNPAGKAPGVYMQEVDVPGPIPGVSTGIVAIVGPAQSGPLNTPVFVTNWTQFLETFGGYIYDPLVYAAHAVRGFFENGGTTCCFVRAGIARCASVALKDRSTVGHPVFSLTAKSEGVSGNKISAQVINAGLCATEAQKSAAVVELIDEGIKLSMGSLGDTLLFVPGDIVCISQDSLTEEAEVVAVSGADKEISLKSSLVKAFSPGGIDPVTIRPADLQNKKRVRLESVLGLEPGSYLKISQSGIADPEYAVVEGFDGNTVLLRTALQSAFSLEEAADPVTFESMEFSLMILADGALKETYTSLSTVPYHSRYYEKIITGSTLIEAKPADLPNPSPPPYNLPNIGNFDLAGGFNDNPGGLILENYKNAIDALEKVDINILCIPDAVAFGPADTSVQQYAVGHCERMADRFMVIDCGRNLSVAGMLEQRKDNFTGFGSSSYGAVYYPWIEIAHPAGQGRLKVPPSGHIAGVYARTDDSKGVHKAPANEIIKGSFGPESLLNPTEHGMLNEVNINVIVNTPGSGTTIMGARTLSDSTQWRYINVRRLLLYIEKSVQNATRFAVFLPNNQSLWATIKRQVSSFLHNVWRSGALFGSTPNEAFWVKVDEELNPPSLRALGQLVIEVVLFPVTPAEYIVFRVIQEPGGPSVSE
ncbi:MAG: phage tail sheath subtilisin-like domain-containing protein [Clostridiales bacterium]|nr:phage tail sheath subtilisin-like domain-containing protein [Clostridiales bacterium]